MSVNLVCLGRPPSTYNRRDAHLESFFLMQVLLHYCKNAKSDVISLSFDAVQMRKMLSFAAAAAHFLQLNLTQNIHYFFTFDSIFMACVEAFNSPHRTRTQMKSHWDHFSPDCIIKIKHFTVERLYNGNLLMSGEGPWHWRSHNSHYSMVGVVEVKIQNIVKIYDLRELKKTFEVFEQKYKNQKCKKLTFKIYTLITSTKRYEIR